MSTPRIWLLLVTAVLLTRCVGIQSSSTVEAIQSSVGQAGGEIVSTPSNAPIVEAYIQYPGPPEKWAGPVSFVVHVSARDRVETSVSPPWLRSAPARRLAAEDRTLSINQVREILGQLAHQDAATARECIHPIRIRFIHADGAILEKYGCRSQSDWSEKVSEAVDTFLHG